MNLTNPARRLETDMGPAVRRLQRFVIVAIVGTLALTAVLAVKAQVFPTPHWQDLFTGYERLH